MYINSAKIIESNIEGDNGIIHIIDILLVPYSTVPQIKPIPGSPNLINIVSGTDELYFLLQASATANVVDFVKASTGKRKLEYSFYISLLLYPPKHQYACPKIRRTNTVGE